MEKMDLSLTPRAESVREPQRSISPVHFELAEIKKHFDESLNGIKKQGETAAKFSEKRTGRRIPGYLAFTGCVS